MINAGRFGKVLKGSLIWLIMIIITVMFSTQAALAASTHQELKGLSKPQKMSLDVAMNGIVRIEAGKLNDKKKFKVQRKASGFIASKSGGNVYIVTTWHTVNLGEDTVVHVIMKNDSAIDATIEAYSKKHDYCILRTDNALNEKNAVPLRILQYDKQDRLGKGDTVISLGFSKSAGAGTEFSASDVVAQRGTISNTEYVKKKTTYIEHSAKIAKGLSGGVLVDENGYVIGLNNIKTKGEDDLYYALDIIEVDKLLDSKGISHRTKDKDELYSDLYDLCDHGLDIYKQVKKKYRENLAAAITDAIRVMTETPENREALQSSYDKLDKQIRKSEMKMPKELILVIALGALIAGLAVRLLTLILWDRKYGVHPEKSSGRKKKTGKNCEDGNERNAGQDRIAGRTGRTGKSSKGHLGKAGKAPEKAVPQVTVAPAEGAPDSAAGMHEEAGFGQPGLGAASALSSTGMHERAGIGQPEAGRGASNQPEDLRRGSNMALQGRENSEKQAHSATIQQTISQYHSGDYSDYRAEGARMREPRLYMRSTGEEIVIDKSTLVIGRSIEADLIISDDNYVSRMHAVIENKLGMYFIRDLGTTNGVYLNGTRIGEAEIRLVPGDLIKIGRQEIEFR